MQIKPSTKFKNTDEYIAVFPQPVQKKLEQLRASIKKAAPKAEEVISYNMPAFKQGAVLVYFAGYDKHIGFYPTALPIKTFAAELTNYKTSKGAIQFLLNEELPLKLVTEIVKFRIAQTEQARENKSK